MSDSKKVVIIGAGFGGLMVAKSLSKRAEVQVVLIDRRNHHLFQPLLYQVATAGLSPAEIAVPIRAEMSAQKNCRVILGNVTEINLSERWVQYDSHRETFDTLVLACGAKHSYFGHDEWEDFAPGLKTLEQATEMRRRILTAFELAENETDLEKQKALLTFVIVGAGPTGVELAGSIAEISRHTLKKDFRSIDPSRTRVILVEAGPRVLAAFDPSLSSAAARALEALGVQVWTGTRVTEINEEGVSFGIEVVRAKTVLWAAGVAPSSLGRKLGTPLDSVGRVKITDQLCLEEHPNVFVIGDMAASGLPGLSPVAIQQGKHVAKQIEVDLTGGIRTPFKYFDKGIMATIGRSRAVLQVGRVRKTGFIAWIMWLFVHIYFLIGFKNKFFVFVQWAWSYFSFKRGARLIVSKNWKSK